MHAHKKHILYTVDVHASTHIPHGHFFSPGINDSAYGLDIWTELEEDGKSANTFTRG